MEQSAMPHVTTRVPLTVVAALVLAPAVSVFAQSGQAVRQAASTQPPPTVRRITVDEAVKLALEQNLGIQVERVNPRIQDVAIAQARSLWTPTVSSTLSNNSANQPPTSSLAGSQTKVTDSRFSTEIAVAQTLRTGANYNVAWDSSRAKSTNLFNTFDPVLRSNVSLNFTQPLLRGFKIDSIREQLAVSRKDRDAADLQLQSTIVATTRNVKNAYWELAYQIASLNAAQQSLDLSKRVLGDNEKRVQIGTMAPIDIVEAQSEVARNEESVIVAEAAIKRAEDSLRALIYDPSSPDFWNIQIEPNETGAFTAQSVDAAAAVQRALGNRLDVKLAKNSLQRTDINVRFYQNDMLPSVNAQATFNTAAVGGAQLQQVSFQDIAAGIAQRNVIAQRSFGSVLGDVISSAYPTWTVGVTVSYPVGTSTAETNLARSKLQYEQGERQLKNLELQVATEVRDLARQVETNQKRVDTTRAARELAERRLDAAEKKFAAGIETNFFVFQAQRDLAQARTNEVRAISDYNKSLVDFEAVQEAPLR
jgi:outer membrane protein TolC